jgi:hypothetical protein
MILLVAGDEASNWSGWYRHAIPRAEQLYETSASSDNGGLRLGCDRVGRRWRESLFGKL